MINRQHVFRLGIIAFITIMITGILTLILYNLLAIEGINGIFRNIGMSVKDSDIMTGAISVGLVNLAVYYFDEHYKKKMGDILKFPKIDFIGYIFGTYIYTLLF